MAPMFASSNPSEPTDWRAVCGKTARTVRREGGLNSTSPSYPYLSSCPLGLVMAEASFDHFREMREKCVFRVSHSRMGVTERESSGILTVWLRSFGFGI